MGMRSAIQLGIASLLAVALTGCAQQQPGQAAAKQAVTTGVDFSKEGDANLAAGNFAARLLGDLQPLPGYAGGQILSYGVEVDLVGSPSDAVRAVVARDAERYHGTVIPVRYRRVLHTEKELDALKDRIFADRDEWARQGIMLSAWGIDVDSNTVQIDISHYTDRYRDALIAQYGNLITVTPRDVSYSGN
jgi:hypothetical protein